jgi:glycosyltransferase involved in cell wall biosynthesis
MKIATIDPVGNKAGIDHYDVQLLNGLVEAGDECFLYSNFDYNGTSIRYKRWFVNAGVSKVSAITSNFIGFFKGFIDAKRNGVKWLILHVFRAGVFDLFMFSVARILGFKIVAIVHDIESLDTFTVPFVRKTVIGTLPTIRVVHNEFCKLELEKSIGKKSLLNTGIIPHVNFVDLFKSLHEYPSQRNLLKQNSKIQNQLFPEIANALNENIPLILFFGQIKKAKGVDILLEAISKSKTNYKVIIAGKLRNEIWDKYQSIINKNNIQERVIPIIRHISDEERDVLFTMSKCIVLPYRWIYQSGVLLMTMSFPMTIIASNLPPNADLISDNKNGLLFTPEDSNALAEKIDSIVNNPTLANELQKQAFIDVQKFNSSTVIGKQYHDLISEYNSR